jgi:hypothetical protein
MQNAKTVMGALRERGTASSMGQSLERPVQVKVARRVRGVIRSMGTLFRPPLRSGPG